MLCFCHHYCLSSAEKSNKKMYAVADPFPLSAPSSCILCHVNKHMYMYVFFLFWLGWPNTNIPILHWAERENYNARFSLWLQPETNSIWKRRHSIQKNCWHTCHDDIYNLLYYSNGDCPNAVQSIIQGSDSSVSGCFVHVHIYQAQCTVHLQIFFLWLQLY